MDLKRIKDCLEGKRDAQKSLYESYKHNMYVLCLRYFNNTDDASDALQEGFIKVFRDLHQYDASKGVLGSWMKKVFVNTCLEILRKNKIAFQELDDNADLISNNENISTNLNHEDIVNIIQKLPTGYRTVFNLYVIEGYNHKEISQQLNISENTSKTQLMKAKNMLKTLLEEVFK